MQDKLKVGMVGHGFMGAAHSHAWHTAGRHFALPLRPLTAVLCGRREDAVRAAAEKYGWADTSTDWRELVTRDDIDLVDVCTPGHAHAEVALAALAAGKHVLCEKPLANTVEEALTVAVAARKSEAHAMVGFNYRRIPAVVFARKLIAEGRLGAIRHVRARYLQDWLADPASPMSWRLRGDEAGSGALGDIGSHITDLTQYLVGQRLTAVTAQLTTFTKERPLPEGEHAFNGVGGGSVQDAVEAVTVDDAAVWLGRFADGMLGTYEASRTAVGRKNALTVEIDGTLGSVVFDLERLNELELFESTGPAAEQGFRRVLVTEADHPYVGGWWPPGHVLGWEHTFVHQVVDLVTGISTGVKAAPDFTDGLQVQLALDAVQRSALSGIWEDVADAAELVEKECA